MPPDTVAAAAAEDRSRTIDLMVKVAKHIERKRSPIFADGKLIGYRIPVRDCDRLVSKARILRGERHGAASIC